MLTEQQLSARKKGIGGSDAAAIAGLSKWKTPLDVYRDKLGLSEMQKENKFMRFGNILEPIILKEYSEITGNKVCTAKMQTSKKYPWMIGNIDGWAFGKNIVVECKTASIYTLEQWGDPGTDEMPTEYLLQCAHYAIVCDASKVDLAVLIGGNDFRIYTYERNEKLEEGLIEKERKFWHEHILAQAPPEPMTPEDVLKLYPDSAEKQVMANNNLIAKAYELARIKQNLKELERKEGALKFEIQAEMKDADTLVDVNFNKLATWKSQTANRLDMERLKKEKPEIYTGYLKESTSRAFRLNNKLEA